MVWHRAQVRRVLAGMSAGALLLGTAFPAGACPRTDHESVEVAGAVADGPPVDLGTAIQALRGPVERVEGGLVWVRLDAEVRPVRPPAGAGPVTPGQWVVAVGPPPLGPVFEPDRLLPLPVAP